MNNRDATYQGSPDRFGHEWATYREVLPESRAQLERWMGSTGLPSFSGKRVLDVGCGMGRNPYWMLKAGAGSVVAVDVDPRSIDAAKSNLAPFPNAQVLRVSAYELDPGTLGAFERVTCIGVLHHLQDPALALQKLWSCVSPGGDLILWCYGNRGNRLFIPLIQAIRWFGSRLPIRWAHVLAKLITLAAWPFIRTLPWRTEYYRRLKELSFRNVESIIFDQILPRIAHYWSDADLRELIRPLGGEVTIELVQGNSWHVRVVKR